MASMAEAVTIAVPCFDERDRLDAPALLRLALADGVRLLLVDDGSTDGTRSLLESLAARCPTRIDVLALGSNRGKAEAVRRGLLAAVAGGAEIVGYLDADLSTPIAEAERLIAKMRSSSLEVLLGSRVKLLGRRIDRRASRHYTGRVFATLASIVLDLPVYDTQCGAKLFRVSPALEAALARPFRSRWSFDVELLQRLVLGCDGGTPVPLRAIAEEPLEVWRDVPGSKVSVAAGVRASASLLRLLGPRLRAGRTDRARAAVVAADAAPAPHPARSASA
ncbi:MAG TPA: glycosyltransferase [Candidatus Binatia bacterium]|nr:glycosyltransferase [Candidatus Binatia bacterium]